MGGLGTHLKRSLFLLGILSAAMLQGACSSKSKELMETQEAIRRMKEEEERVKLMRAGRKEPEGIGRKILLDGIAARVNDDIILLSEVKRRTRLLAFGLTSGEKRITLSPAKKKDIATKALESLIINRLLEQKAEKSGIVVSDKDLKEYLERIRKDKGWSRLDLSVELAKQGLTYEQYLETLRSEIKRAKVVQREVTARIQVTDQECLDYYKAHIADYTSEEEVHLQQIMVFLNTPSSNREIAEKTAFLTGLRQRILNGEDFGRLAKRYSQGPNAENNGDAGFFKKGELLPPIEEAAFSMKVGDLSGVIRTKIGLHLIKLLEKKPKKVVPFSKVKEEIRKKFREKAFAERFNAWLQELKKDAYIEVRIKPEQVL